MYWLILTVPLLSTCVRADRFNALYVWSTGYNAECRIPLTNDISGWSIHFTFDQPIYYVEVYNTKLVYHTDTVWVIESKPESHDQTAGHMLAVNFTVRHQLTTQPILGSYTFHTKGWTVPLWIPRREISYRSRNFDGTIRASIQIAGHVQDNWRVCLLFDHPVTYVKVPTGDVLVHSEREWIISANSNQYSDLEFIVYPSGDMPVTGVYYFEDEGCLSVGEHPPKRLLDPVQVWDGGYNGVIHVQVPVPVKAWKVRFQFDIPIEWLDVNGVTYLNNFKNKFEWVVGSEAGSSHLTPGEPYTFTFTVRQYGSNPTLGLYTIIPEPIDAVVTMKYNYGEVLRLSTLFYNAQRSGKLPANNEISWRGDSALFDSDNGHDLTGGWYNDGGHVKANLPMAFSTWLLEWGMLKFPDSYATSGQLSACDMIKWPLEYLLKSWIPERNILYVQVGDKSRDNANWVSPEVMNMWRPAFSVNTSCPGSDVAANTVSAFAAGYLLLKDACQDTSFADTLLHAAESLFTFARSYRGVYSNCVKQPASFYRSTDDSDDLAMAAMWMYRTKYEARYLTYAIHWFPSHDTPDQSSWDDTSVAAALLLYEATHDHKYETYVNTFLGRYMPSGSVPYTHCGLAWTDKWGPNRYAANAAFIAIMATELGLEDNNNLHWAMSQIHYILGENKMNESYLIGFGSSFPRRPHHRGSSCSKLKATCSYLQPGPNMNTLLGALVSGPDVNDDYTDRRTNYIQNGVACDYNAGFQSAVAGLLNLAKNLKLPSAPVSKC